MWWVHMVFWVGRQGIPGWSTKSQTAAGKIMELLKAVIYFAPRAKRYEHLERGVQW